MLDLAQVVNKVSHRTASRHHGPGGGDGSTRTMIWAVGPKFGLAPPGPAGGGSSRNCTVSNVSPTGKRCSVSTGSQNCAVESEFTAEGFPNGSRVHAVLGTCVTNRQANTFSALVIAASPSVNAGVGIAGMMPLIEHDAVLPGPSLWSD